MFNFGSKNYEFVSIGDTVIDAFIRLKEAHVNCKIDTNECEICMKFADKIPFESVDICNAVGNSANAAVSAKRLGLKSAIITNVGDDTYANDIFDTFTNEGIGTQFVKRNKNQKTNYHYVLWYGPERTILIKHEKYPYSFPKNVKTKWLYLSSLGENSLEFHNEIANYLDQNPEVKFAFQPGTYQIRFGKEKLSRIYKRADIFFCNKEEAGRILGTENLEIKNLLTNIHNLGPKITVITDGPNGAYAYDGTNAYFMPLYPDKREAFERTGAGDAFASTFTVAIALGKNVEEALKWAPINSMSVVQDIGAQRGLLSREKIEEYIKNAPEDYAPKKI